MIDSDTPRSFVYTNKELEVLNDPRSFLKLGKEKPVSFQSDEEAEAVAAELVKREIVEKRLGGSDLGYKRWASQNRSYLAYKVGLKKNELLGKAGAVTDTDEAIFNHDNKREWFYHNGSYVDPAGRSMGRAKALLRGMPAKVGP